MQPDSLKELVEGKFVDALRTVAAEMTMEDLHEKRGEYIRRVRDTVADDLLKNGLELESASLTQLDQTDMEFFNPSNAFDAEGLTRLTESIETRKKKRNDIEQDTLIQIRNKNLETEKMSLEIDRDSEYARLQAGARAGDRARGAACGGRARARGEGAGSRERADHRAPGHRDGAHRLGEERSRRSASPASATCRRRRSSAARPSSWPSSSARSRSRSSPRRSRRRRPRPTRRAPRR